MAHTVDKHLEHAQHAEHMAHNEFDRKVATSMAMIAATLAFVTMQSHRAHNETLRLQNEANRIDGEANILLTRAANTWNHYQFWSTRQMLFHAFDPLLDTVSKQADAHNQAKIKAFLHDGTDRIARYQTQLESIKNEARTQTTEGESLQKKANEKLKESEHFHHRGSRIDYGQLGLELSLVVCSLSVLSKRSLFWFVGIVVGVVGFCIAISAFFMRAH